MNTRSKDYDKDQQTQTEPGAGKFPDHASTRSRFVSRAELESIICAYHKISDQAQQGRDRRDGERS